MRAIEDWILDILADVIARFIVGFGTAAFVLFQIMGHMPLELLREWKVMLAIAGAVGVFAGAFGLRKGPGLI